VRSGSAGGEYRAADYEPRACREAHIAAASPPTKGFLRLTDMTTDLYLAIMSTIEAVAVCIASIAAVWGIKAWRKETVGKRKIELAEETIEKFHAAKDWIQLARHPFAPAGAGRTRPQAEDEDSSLKARADALYVAAERLTQKAELFSRLGTLRYLMHAYFGDEVDPPFRTMVEVHNEVMIASQLLAARMGRSEWWETTTGADGAVGGSRLREELEKTIWLIDPPDRDEITQKLNGAWQEIERICRPHLR
jgi:hypothetical protein